MTDPYFIEGPAFISFSGGRTSGYMLKHILDAHGGELPDGVHIVFANTGKERPETLRFVHDCATNWGARVRWVEWRDNPEGFEEVGFNSASRNGEPFERLIAKKKRLPNWQERWCTQYLKIEPMTAFAASLGYAFGQYKEVIGLRYDEGHRILKGLARNEGEGRQLIWPLSKAKVTKADVMAFWKEQPFDLALQWWEGNCDFCFLKGKAIRKRIIRDDPTVPLWWHEREVEQNGFFSARDRVAELIDECWRTPTLFDEPIAEEDFDTECGLTCPPVEDAAI
jgi:3'-phosphoadenosine 5'-phosphosulfate sulfotransferase (PAPS reductase)/FAD synthetase